MLFDVQAALAEILREAPVRCDSREICDLRGVESRKSQESQPVDVPAPSEVQTPTVSRIIAPVAQPPNRVTRDRSPNDARPDADGYCRTWTGRVVRLDEWRQLSAWDRHGPAGRLFCANCKRWVVREGECHQPGCWKAEGGDV